MAFLYFYIIYLYVFFTEIAKRVCREFHIQDEEILQLLMADNSDGEDDLDEKKNTSSS